MRASERYDRSQYACAEQDSRDHAEVGEVGQTVRAGVLPYTRHDEAAAQQRMSMGVWGRCDVQSIVFNPLPDRIAILVPGLWCRQRRT